jgi:hypothetical protein
MKCMSIRSLISGKRAQMAAAAAVAAAFAALPAVSPRLHAQGKPIQVFLSAMDAAGQPVADLKAEDVSILVNGSACATTKFEPITWPVKLQLIVDNGPIHIDAMRQVRAALKLFVAELPADIEVSTISIDPIPRVLYKGTDHAKVLSSIDILSPDTGAPRFIDGLTEASDRINKDKTDKKNPEKGNYFPVLMVLGSDGSEGSGVRDSDIAKMLKQVTDNGVTAHVLIQADPKNRGAAATDPVALGRRLTMLTGGRFEGFDNETPYARLLPEYGKQIARSHLRQSHQYRVTCQPSVATPSEIVANVARPNVTATLTLDGRMP